MRGILLVEYVVFSKFCILLSSQKTNYHFYLLSFSILRKLGVHLSVNMSYTCSYRMAVLVQFTQVFMNLLSIT